MSKFDQRYLEMAEIWAKNSYCKRRQVGALLVKNNMIISDGYNGTPSGFENVCEENGVTKPFQGGQVGKQQRGCYPLCYRIAMHRMRQAYHTERNKAGGL